MLRPWHVNIPIKRDSATSVYLQIAYAIIEEVRRGRLAPGDALPGTRELAEDLSVSRKTIVLAYDELVTQGWVYSEQKRGTFVSNSLPKLSSSAASAADNTVHESLYEPALGYSRPPPDLELQRTDNELLTLDDGSPDTRIAPMLAFGRAYRSAVVAYARSNRLGYGDPRGLPTLRQAISTMLNLDRGLSTTADHICMVRGSQMGIYLASRVFSGPGDTVVMEQLSYPPAREAFRAAGAQVVCVGLDSQGILLDDLEETCRRRRVRAIYVTPHHQFPTTVLMPPERRMRLLMLSEQFGFTIIEDDYDHEFHFTHQPMLPLASTDRWGKVVYIGSMSKLLSPSIRMGYVAASPAVIDRLALSAALIDRQGDPATESAIAEMIEAGEIKRHTRRALKVYDERRGIFADLLRSRLADQIHFRVPDGGLAFWAQTDPALDLEAARAAAARLGLGFYTGAAFAIDGAPVAGARLGFARLNPDELERAVDRLRRALTRS